MTGPAIVVRADDPLPPYEQIRRQIAGVIASGRLQPGDRLPPLRQLARDLDVAVGTVGRAYRDLEAQGWVESRRGRGTHVLTPPTATVAPPTEDLHRLARDYLAAAMELGFTRQQAIDAVHR